MNSLQLRISGHWICCPHLLCKLLCNSRILVQSFPPLWLFAHFSSVAYDEVLTEEELERIQAEFGRVGNEIYLDHAGATLYPDNLIKAYASTLLEGVFGNPHSRNPSSSACTDAIDRIRTRILRHFGTDSDEYAVIFTSGATSALRLVAESFRFYGGPFVYMEESHTSVVGMRQVVAATAPCGQIFAIPADVMATALQHPSSTPNHITNARLDDCEDGERQPNGLVAFPAQCNFSGTKYPLKWIETIHKHGLNSDDLNGHSIHGRSQGQLPKDLKWYVMLDGAAFVGTNHLDLATFRPDFTAISFYKMFGFPTGLGALLVRRASGHLLQKRYVGGGTVQVIIPTSDFYVPRKELEGKFEDGTVDFLSILALGSAFDSWDTLGLSLNKIKTRTFSLCQYAYRMMVRMKHSNGLPLVKVYSASPFDSAETAGHILAFNILKDDGSYVGYSQVEEIGFVNRIHLRYGCFCNPGACRKFLGYEPQDLMNHFQAGHVCGDMRDLVDGKPTGAVRLSVGYMTRKSHIDTFLKLIYTTWTQTEVKVNGTLPPQIHPNTPPALTHILIYPVKSCAPFQVKGSWTMGEGGLTFDRQWLIVTSLGIGLSQKREPKLVAIRPRIDLHLRILELSTTDGGCVSVPLEMTGEETESDICNSKVCGEKVVGLDCGPTVASWLDKVLGHRGLKLMRILPLRTQRQRQHGRALSLANDSHFVLVSAASLRSLANQLLSKGVTLSQQLKSKDIFQEMVDDLLLRFRPNLVVEWREAYAEEEWDAVEIGGVGLKSGGPCSRCATICTDQHTGQRSSEPLLSLANRTKGSPRFGIHLYRAEESHVQTIAVGDPLVTFKKLPQATSDTKGVKIKTKSINNNRQLIASID